MSDDAPGTGPSSADGEGQDNRDVSEPDGPEGTAASGSGDSGPDSSAAGSGAGTESGGEPPVHGAYAVETPEQLLSEARKARRQARRARHAYWFPLVLFGLLTCASIPFYIQRIPGRSRTYAFGRVSGLARFFNSDYLGGSGFLTGRYLAYYWLAAMMVGLAATAAWYRLRGERVGLRTPSRGFVVTGLVLLLLALLVPVLSARGVRPLGILMPGDLLTRGTFPFVLISVGLCVLAWAERSIALTVIAAGYLALSLVASLYNIENVFYKLGWNINAQAGGLPNVVLPALALLLSGASAWVVQRRSRRPRRAGPADGGITAATGPA
ncbi:MAG TPA: hypothetical protein VLM11_15795 [Streptosporangiaceae bacterium]|nr:hypothetical protein [Streptosporangiaceae bacterium]